MLQLIEIRFVTRLQPNQIITKNFLRIFSDLETPVDRVVERDTFKKNTVISTTAPQRVDSN